MTDHLRNRIAKALEREDVLNCGYDHSFASTYGVDPETDGFVDAVLATLLDGAEREPRIPLDQHTPASLDGLYDDLDRYAEVLGEMNDNAVRAARELGESRATNQRLNCRAQALESELAAYRRAAADWEITDNSTYVPLRTLAAIAKAAGLEVPERWELHYQRVERAEAELRQHTEADSADAAAGSYAMRAETAETRLTAVAVLRDDLRETTGARWIADALDHILGEQTPAHVYLSTGCFHGDHDYCKAMTGLNGAKRPASCKKCGAKCVCGCHGTVEMTAPPEPGLYDKIAAMFSGPLPPPTDEPPATVLPCNWAHTRYAHTPHRWQPQPGMRHVQCPGYAPVPAATEATDTTREH